MTLTYKRTVTGMKYPKNSVTLARQRMESSVAKPMMTDSNNKKSNIATHLFDAMDDLVHVDESLFYLSKVKRKYVLLPDEPKPVHRLKSKRHIPMVMMLAAVARSRYYPVTEECFDGEFGGPDMVVLGLAVFNALQTRQERMPAHTLDELREGMDELDYFYELALRCKLQIGIRTMSYTALDGQY
ncbi:hypothetical protein PHMEG_0006698 [Phytophthora megakarya]|uniref:Uncharacterized protein n=1 Tax=Phytophthora megakarya TaxID=4795 RepID=A0A225WQE2_9STRA|nr:hypothetical protein PHMEG_0006698 [Phytophthora megakarya]